MFRYHNGRKYHQKYFEKALQYTGYSNTTVKEIFASNCRWSDLTNVQTVEINQAFSGNIWEGLEPK